MLNIQDYKDKFKSARNLSYYAFVCKIPVGSAVIDKIRNCKAYDLVGKKQVLTPLEVKEISMKNANLFQLIRGSIITNAQFVINIAGNMEVITAQDLMSQYEFLDGAPITQSRLLTKAYICEEQQGINTPVNITLNRAYKLKISNPESNIVMNWFRVIAKDSDITQEAMYINRREMPEFNMYLPLDNKDYLVVISNNDISSAKFLSVEDFKYRYDLHGWSKLLGNDRVTMIQPKPLFTLTESTHGVKTFSVVIENMIDELYKNSIAIKSGVVTDFLTETWSRDVVAISFNIACGPIFVLAYKKDGRYNLAFGNEDAFNGFGQNVEQYIDYLEKNHFVTLSLKDFKIYKELFIAFLSLFNSSALANYKMPLLSDEERQSLRDYTGIEYQNINMYLRGEISTDAFGSYLHAMHISEYLDRCQVLKNSWHFRGMTISNKLIPKELKSGVVIPSDSFVSTTITSPVAFDFAADGGKDETSFLFLFKNTTKKHGAFIDLVSEHRGNEYEVLFNIGTGFKLIKRLGWYHEEDAKPAQVWLVEIVEDRSAGIRKYQYKQDEAEKLVNTLQSSELMKAFYINEVDEQDTGVVKVVLHRYNVNDLTISISLYKKNFTVEFSGTINCKYQFSIKEKGYNHLLQYIFAVINEKGLSNNFNETALSSFSEQFMLNLLSTFTTNNFIISSQRVNIGFMQNPFTGSEFMIPEEANSESPEVRSSEFTILTSELKTLSVDIDLEVLKSSAEIQASIRASIDNGKVLSKVVSLPLSERNNLYYAVYNTLVQKFSLDSTRRLKHIFSLVSGYYEKYLEFSGSNGIYQVGFEDKMFNITQSGVVIHVSYEDRGIDLNYYDDVYSLASQVQTLI